MIISTDNSRWLNCENTRRNWLRELSPLATFVSATLRNDLGRESADLFRERVTLTQFVPLHPMHIEALNKEEETRETNPLSAGTINLGQLIIWGILIQDAMTVALIMMTMNPTLSVLSQE